MQLLFCFDKTRDVKEKSFQTSSAKHEEKLEVNFQQRFLQKHYNHDYDNSLSFYEFDNLQKR